MFNNNICDNYKRFIPQTALIQLLIIRLISENSTYELLLFQYKILKARSLITNPTIISLFHL